MHKYVYLNTEIVEKSEAKVSVLDRGFLFADGVYEVVAIQKGKLFLMDEHIHRLNNSMQGLQFQPNEIDLTSISNELIKKNEITGDAILYIQITRGTGDTRNHLITGDETPTVVAFTQSVVLPTIEDLQVGFKAILREDIRWKMCDIKSVSLLPNILLKNEAKKHSAMECLLHREGTVTEGSASNVFIAKNGVVITPPKSVLILPGITRDFIINSVAKLDIKLEEREFSTEELLSADEVWISSTTRDITPITQIDDTKIGAGTPGPIWAAAIKQFKDSVFELI